MALDGAGSGDALGTIRQALHDLNNQLAVVVGGAELLADTPSLTDELLDLATAVLNGAEQASRVVVELQQVVRAASAANYPASVP